MEIIFLAGFLHCTLETRWLGWQFLNGLKKQETTRNNQRWQAGCWLHQCVLRNTLAGSFRCFLCPEMTLSLL